MLWLRKAGSSSLVSLLKKSLLNQNANLGIKRFNLCTNTLAQLAWSKMNIQARCLCTFMSSYQSNLIEADPCSFEDGTALVAQGVRGQEGQAHLLSNTLDDFIKGTNSQGTAWVAGRFRHKNLAAIFTTVSCNERVAMAFNVSTDQVQDGSFDRNRSHPSILGGLWTNGNDSSCPIDVI